MALPQDSDPKMAWEVCTSIRAGKIVVFDEVYVDFDHLYHLHRRGVTRITSAKENICDEVVGQQLSEEEIQQAEHMCSNNIFLGQQPIVLSDCRIKMTANTEANYPEALRMVRACMLVNGKSCEMGFLTNNVDWSAYSICDLYLAKWGIEVFFKEIKQTLQLADFLGTSENAIKWKIWTALLAYFLLRFIGWIAEWKLSFRRLYTFVKGVLWSRQNVSELLRKGLLPTGNKPTPPQITEQLQFDFG